VRFRLELFVADLDASVDFYVAVLEFTLERRDTRYAHLRRGDAELGLADLATLPAAGTGPGFTRESVARTRGAGVEIVLEVEDLEAAARTVAATGYVMAESPQERPWGLRDFRLIDPDGYYLRISTAG
jgi:predicted enzyme related to lactoylglutathione lyase